METATCTPCLNTIVAQQYANQNEARIRREKAAAGYLHSEFVNGLRNGPQTKISTPGFASTTWSVADVVADSFAGASGDADLNELLVILQQASTLPTDLGMRASALIATFARKHAQFHMGDSL